MKYLLNKTEIAGKRFEGVETERISTGVNGYYGGNVDYFGKTKEGFLLCFYKKTEKIIDIYVDEDLLTAEGLKLLLKDKGEEVPFEPAEKPADPPKTKAEERKELIAKAKELKVEGKIATMSTETLKAKIKEAEYEKEN
jgi:hypothetical protein